MKAVLLLVRGDARTFYNLNGQSILADLPIKPVLLVDRGNIAGFQALDPTLELHQIRWSDQAQLLELAKQLHQRHQFVGVETLDESNVGLAADIRALLQLPGIQPEQASWFRHKVLMKQQLMAAGIRVPHFVSCSETETVRKLLGHYGKLVIKPVDGFGSKQVVFIETSAQWQQWLNSHTEELEHYEAEEYIQGRLYHVNALVVQGRAVVTAPALYLPGMSNVEFSEGTPFVSVVETNPALHQALVAYSDSVNAALGLQSGVTHLECFVTDDEEIVFCEIGQRPGGGGIVWMIEAQYGINYNQAAIALAAGEVQRLPAVVAASSVAGLIGIRNARSGFVVQAADEASFALPGVKLAHVAVTAGQFSAAASHCTDFQGLFILDAPDRQSFEQRWRHIYQLFQQNLQLNCI